MLEAKEKTWQVFPPSVATLVGSSDTEVDMPHIRYPDQQEYFARLSYFSFRYGIIPVFLMSQKSTRSYTGLMTLQSAFKIWVNGHVIANLSVE